MRKVNFWTRFWRIFNRKSKQELKELKDILKNIDVVTIKGKQDLPIVAIDFDSRKVKPKGVFVAVRGTQVDGHRFIKAAIDKGAGIIVCETLPETLEDRLTYVVVKNTEKALGQMASNYYDNPSGKLKLVGVTGTNGKTTTVTLLYRLFSGLGYKVGMISTVENRIANRIIPATHTTPDAVQLNELLLRMVDEGCEFAFMEVSSHAVAQQRIAGVTFAGGVFTNLSHDHLDYHKTFKNYLEAKKMFFDNLPKGAFALTNIDDRRGEVMVQNTKAAINTYSLRRPATFKAKIIENTLAGLYLDLDGKEFHSRLIGEFNAYNLLSVYSTGVLLKADSMEVMQVLSELKTAEGRFDYVETTNNSIAGIVDYAHTPDALEKVLETINRLKKGNGNIITVVGCGGDRDKKKRPVMAKVACDYSNHVILTSDNPRSEQPETILKDMEAGIPPYATNRVVTIVDRKAAITAAVETAKPQDIILVAGKGHEKYQEIKGEKFPFDDKEILQNELNQK